MQKSSDTQQISMFDLDSCCGKTSLMYFNA